VIDAQGGAFDREVIMRRPLIATATAAGAALAIGLIAIPALASNSGPTTPNLNASAGAGAGYGPGGWGMGYGRGGAGMTGNGWSANDSGTGMGRWAAGDVDPLTGLSQGSLSAEQKAKLAGMAEEEKLAHDVYVKLAASTNDARFTRIAAAEARHLTEVRALLTRYGITDPTAGKADGQFASDKVQSLYSDLVARGTASLDAALAVGRDIENLDLKDLSTAGTGVTAQDVSTVYTRLANGSRMHLRAFGG
jgi:hypothetical protein